MVRYDNREGYGIIAVIKIHLRQLIVQLKVELMHRVKGIITGNILHLQSHVFLDSILQDLDLFLNLAIKRSLSLGPSRRQPVQVHQTKQNYSQPPNSHMSFFHRSLPP